MKLSWKSAIALLIGGILLGGSLSAMGQSGSEAEDPEVKAVHLRGPGGPGGPGGPLGPHHMGKLVRSESTVQGDEDGTFNTVRMNAGTLTGTDGDTLTIEQADGESYRATVDDDTEIRRDREEAEIGDLEAGDHVVIHQVQEGDGDLVTKHVMAISEEAYAEMEAQREACTDDDASTACERPHRGRPRGPHMRSVEPAAEAA